MPESPNIAVITALPVEAVAVRHVLGRVSETKVADDPNHYVTAELACGVVVTTTLVTSGNTAAADACAHLVRSFPSVRVVVMCGIALGVPRPGDAERDVRLGDVVVGSGGVIHHGHRRITDEGTALRGDPLVASPTLLRGVGEIRALQLQGMRPWEAWLEPLPSLAYRRPDTPDDRQAVEVFYGRVGSGDELLRSARKRDEIAHPQGLLAIEMEAAGVAVSAALAGRECLVIRGISDYGDERKSDLWQPYASLAAAAYLRALLDVLGATDRPRDTLVPLDPADRPRGEAMPYGPWGTALGSADWRAGTAAPFGSADRSGGAAAPFGAAERVRHEAAAGRTPGRTLVLELVALMERVSSLQTPDDRDLVLRLMGPPVDGRVARDSRTRVALITLAVTCLEHAGGLDALVGALTDLEGADSQPVRDLAALARRLQ